MMYSHSDDVLDDLARADADVRIDNAAPQVCRLPVSIMPWGTVRIGGIDVPDSHLTKLECRLLEEVMTRGGRTVSKDQLLSAMYADRVDEPELKIVDVFTCKVRRKLGEHGPKIIETVWGQGFRAGSGYVWAPGVASATVEVDAKTRDLLDAVAAECEPRRRPNELADELLREGLKALRSKLWG